jgi:CheY-like chemotaxis protein
VLVVEDEPDIAGFMGAYFRASGTELVHVDPGTAAQVVERAAGGDTACVLLDLNLSGMTGFDVLEAFRADERVAGIPVIIVSADARAATQERAASLGAVGFVPKPFNVQDLFMAVQALVEPAPAGDRYSSTEDVGSTLLISADSLQDRLAAAVDHARRTKAATTFALISFTGAAASPVVVSEVARRLEVAMPAAVVLGAPAADELAVLFAEDGAAAATAALEAFLADGHLELDLGRGRTVIVSARAGVASCPEHASTGEELYMAADIALAEAADAGRAVSTAR